MTSRSDSFVFFGTSSRAARVLQALVDAGQKPVLVVTRDVRKEETGSRMASPVAKRARSLELEAIRVPRRQDRDWIQGVREVEPKLGVEVEFGMRLPAEAVEAAKKGCVCLHFSLLPKYRGDEPLRCALADGQKKIGVTTYQEDPEAEEDGGSILLQEEVEVDLDEDNYGTLEPVMVEKGAEVLLETMAKRFAGKKIKERKQNEKSATVCPKITARHRKAPYWLNAKAVADRLRSWAPEHGLYTWVKASQVEIMKGVEMVWYDPPMGDTGTFLGMRTGRIAILCDEKTVFGIERIKLKDGTEMGAREFADTEDLDIGMRFV